ncbi:MAG: SMC-Scp complex subunit ScpB [Anaerolineae bacterium]|nr:SMC-Scp complex subunit ScpB [Anaerolineae bacterium]
MTDQAQPDSLTELRKSIEALLFVASGPVSPEQFASALDKSLEEINQGLKRLEEHYVLESGLRLQWHAGRVQITTSPIIAGVVERFLGLEITARLSRAALETLTIITYRQPITRPGIDTIRGVNSDGVLRSLLNKGLVEEVGRAEGPGRPILYGTTSEFLQHFGLSSINELPPFDTLDDESTDEEPMQLLKD